jgi:hypothetical protein
LERFVNEEAKKQENIESITEKAIPLLEGNSDPSKMEDDWVANFFDKCRIISNEEMQSLWGKVLAGEANSPGAYSKRTVNVLSSLDKSDAVLFSQFCGFCWYGGAILPLVYDVQNEIYANKGVHFNSLTHLASVGLITFHAIAGVRRLGLPKRAVIFYFGTPLHLEFAKENGNEFELGHVTLTQAGEQLAKVCGAQRVEGFQEYTIQYWASKGIVVASPWPQAALHAKS